jgi:serine/threonine protein phosphatase PrpC
MMQDSAIAEVLQNGTSLVPIAQELVTLANENGGRDNITVLLIQASTTPEKRGLMARLLGK